MPIALPLSTSGGELSWDDIPTPLMMMDHQGLVWAMNAAARPWFGVDAGNGIAISAMELMPALDMKALLTAALTNRDGDAAAGQVRSLGVTAITNAATGRQQVVELEAWGWRLGGGDSVTLALRDCTEHYARERRLRRQRHHFREVLRKAPIGLAIC
ncbi:MAG: hypothetical protein VX663_02090, partial [Pseudomonadota bacterium]|nr:hypothetical protein [Pseudomonadota bacterium]